MTALFTYAEGSLLLRLVIAHVLTDFFLQPDKWVEKKKEKRWASLYLFLHAVIAGALSLVCVWDMHVWPIALVISVTHYVIDGIKLSADLHMDQLQPPPEKLPQKKLRNFILDQIAHLVVILVAWLLLIHGAGKLNIAQVVFNYHVLLYLTGYLVVLSPAGYLIGMFTNRWADELDLKDSLKDVGKWIGMMERLIILTLVLLNQFAGIGFLITAKSLLRLIDKPDAPSFTNTPQKFSSRKHTEYVLAGTFLSISIALVTGMLIRFLLGF